MAEEGEEPGIKWGRQTGRGGKNKKINFYESFTFDDVEYSRYDCVYLFKEDEPEPYVGKLLKMWETSSKEKKGKVLWFFHPEEISNFVGSEDLIENEVFLASGEASGLANINPLEAIAGKCNVVCISKDSRNPQPRDEEVRKADFVFRRTFDVGCLKIKDEIEEEIAGTNVKFLLNKTGSREGSGTIKVSSGTNEVCKNTVQNDPTVATSEQNAPKDSEAVKMNGHFDDRPANEDADLNVLSTKPESPTRENIVPDVGVDTGNAEKTNQTEENASDQKALSKSKVESKKRKDKVKKVTGRVESKGKGKRAKGLDESDDKPSKKAKLTSENVDKGKNVMQELIPSIEAIDTQTLSLTTLIDVKDEVKPIEDSPIEEKGPSKQLKLGKKKTKSANEKLLKISSQECCNEDKKSEGPELAITPKDKRKWFKDLPWEDELRDSHEQRKLVLLQNLDPSYTSAEVKDIIMQGFKENCKAKMIQQTAFSNPRSGQAFVIFDTRETAEMVVKKLKESCLLLSNGSPLIASPGTPCFPEKKAAFSGHLLIEKLRCSMHRDQKDAVSTSHCAQPRTMEYDMAIEWRVLQERSNWARKKLYQKQEEDVRKLKAQLKATFNKAKR